MTLIRLPRRFLDDHDERLADNVEGIPLVVRVKETARFAWVSDNDPGLVDLVNDAEHYSDADEWSQYGDDNAANRPIAQAARRVLAILKPKKGGLMAVICLACGLPMADIVPECPDAKFHRQPDSSVGAKE